MKVCECCMCIMDVDLSPSHTVKEIKQLLSKRTSIPVESFALFFNGKFLRNNNALSEYGIEESSVIHMLVFKSEVQHDSGVKQAKVTKKEDLLKCTDSDYHLKLENEEEEELSRNMSLIEYISDYAYQLFSNFPPDEISYDDFKNYVISNPSIIQRIFSSPLFQDVLSDHDLFRHLLLLNPMITQFIEMNPEFASFIENDENLDDIFSILLDPSSYTDLNLTMNVIMNIIEKSIGHPFHFQSLDEILPSSPTPDSSPIPICNCENCLIAEATKKKEENTHSSKFLSAHHGKQKFINRYLIQIFHVLSENIKEIQKSQNVTENQSTTVIPNFWNEKPVIIPGSMEKKDREEHINLLCQIVANRPDILIFYMKNTPMYKRIEQTHPGLLNEIITPSNIALLSKPEVIRTIIHADQLLEQLKNDVSSNH